MYFTLTLQIFQWEMGLNMSTDTFNNKNCKIRVIFFMNILNSCVRLMECSSQSCRSPLKSILNIRMFSFLYWDDRAAQWPLCLFRWLHIKAYCKSREQKFSVSKLEHVCHGDKWKYRHFTLLLFHQNNISTYALFYVYVVAVVVGHNKNVFPTVN